jgi:hypothetical protein
MSRQERKKRATKKVELFKIALAKFINSPRLFNMKKKMLISEKPQEKSLIERACIEMAT